MARGRRLERGETCRKVTGKRGTKLGAARGTCSETVTVSSSHRLVPVRVSPLSSTDIVLERALRQQSELPAPTKAQPQRIWATSSLTAMLQRPHGSPRSLADGRAMWHSAVRRPTSAAAKIGSVTRFPSCQL